MASRLKGLWQFAGGLVVVSCLAGCNGRGGSVLPFTRQRSPEEKLERKIDGLSQANPKAQVASALKKGKRQFIAFFNSNWKFTVPGIPGDRDNSLVALHGVNIITGTSTNDLDAQAAQLAKVVESFGKRYNAALVKSLLSKPDAKTKALLAQARAELRALEKSDPQQAALRAFRSGNPQIIRVTGERETGVPDVLTAFSRKPETRVLKSNALILSGADLQRFRKVMKTFVIPYNTRLIALLEGQGMTSPPRGYD